MLPTLPLLGLQFHPLTPYRLAEAALSRYETEGSATIVTPNALMLAAICHRPALRQLLAEFDLTAPDGDGVRLAARLCRRKIPLKCAGIEVGHALVRLAAERGLSLFLCGGRPGVAERAAKRLTDTLPTLRIAGVCDGYQGEAILQERIVASGAVIVFVCLGFPKQEQFIAACRRVYPAVYAALGGSLDVYAGDRRRAPRLFQLLHAEWLWRVLCEPRRILRLAPLPRFYLSLLANRLGLRPSRRRCDPFGKKI